MQKDVNRFIVPQSVPEIYRKNERLKNRGMCFFVIDCTLKSRRPEAKKIREKHGKPPLEKNKQRAFFQLKKCRAAVSHFLDGGFN